LLDDISARRLRPLTPVQRAQEDNLLGQIQRLDERIGMLAARRSPGAQNEARADHLRQQRDTLRGQLLELERSIEAQLEAFGGQRASLEKIQAMLPPDAALVGWVDEGARQRSESLHWACLVSARGDPIWVRVAGSGADGTWTDQDDRRRDQLRDALLGKGPGWRELAADVARQRLVPLKPHLSGLRRLIVLPSPDLAGIPVEVLLEAWTDGPPLVVSYSPSGTLFAEQAKKAAGHSGPARLLAVGDPLYDSPSEGRAPGSRPSEGVQIIKVEYPKGQPGGLQLGDILLTYEGREIFDPKQFRRVYEEVQAQRKSARARGPFRPSVTLMRDGTVRSFVLDPHPVNMSFRSWRGRLEPKEALPRLPGTRREVEAIAALFPAAGATTLLGERATETAVQRLASSGELARYRFLHFATHGTTNPDVAMSSALILGPGDKGRPPSDLSAVESDGRITAEQILNSWNLDADLVVFSACETGLGRQVVGEGYLGFAQALSIKGARSLVLSQWSVNDVATALLMVRFCRNLLGERPGPSKPMPKAEALDEAKRWLRNLTRNEVIREVDAIQERGKVRPLAAPGGSATAPSSPPSAPSGPRPFEHPQFWAAFILIGDPS
jgi:CHAT domain-containing protein